MLNEIAGDLFSSNDALAHCVSADLKMARGIAATFKAKFGGVDELRACTPKTGGCLFLQRDGRYIYYLVTKDRYYMKPTPATLQSSLDAMKSLCMQHGVSSVSIPRIGCGLDRMDWTLVKTIIERVFFDGTVTVTAYTL